MFEPSQIIRKGFVHQEKAKEDESYMLHYQGVATFMQGLCNKKGIHNQM